MRSPMRPIVASFLAFCVLLVGIASFFAWTPSNGGGVPSFWIFAGAPAVVLAVIAVAWGARERLLHHWASFRPGDITRGVVGAAALYVVAWCFARTVASSGSTREIWIVSLYAQLGDPRSMRAQAPLMAAAILFLAACEEIVWRGLVTQLISDWLGSRWAWSVAALLYAASYLPTMWSTRAGGGLNPTLPLGALAGGLLWGAMARAFGSLVPSVVAHAFFDWAALIAFPLWGIRGAF